MIHIRAIRPDEEPGVVPGTLEFTTSTGLRYRRTPTRATPAAVDLDDPLVATAAAHADLRSAQTAAGEARMDADSAMRARNQAARPASIGDLDDGEFDGEDRAWRRSRADRARRLIVRGAPLQPEPPF